MSARDRVRPARLQSENLQPASETASVLIPQSRGPGGTVISSPYGMELEKLRQPPASGGKLLLHAACRGEGGTNFLIILCSIEPLFKNSDIQDTVVWKYSK